RAIAGVENREKISHAMDPPSGSPRGERVRCDALWPGAPGYPPDQTGKSRYERHDPYPKACRTFPGYSRPSRNWPEKDRPPLQRPSNRLSGCAPWKSGYSRDTRSRSRRRAGRLGIFCPRTNRHDGELEIGAGRLLRNNARGHAENRRAARDVGNHNRVRAHHDVVADRDRSDDLTTGPEIAIVSNSRTTDATHV